jgi:4-amino-4-deoxy-L-arabinose transferase-like glycosyltransferase
MNARILLDPRSWSRFAIGLVLIALFGLGVRVLFIVAEAPAQVSGDSVFYDVTANLMADGHGYIDPYHWMFETRQSAELGDGTVVEVVTPSHTEIATAKHPPAYTVYLSLFSRLGLTSTRDHQLASAFLGAASIIIAGLLGRALAGARVGLITAAITALYANMYISDGLVMSETISIFFVFLTSWLAVSFWQRSTISAAVLLGVAGACAALSRVELLLYLPVIAIAVFIRSSLPLRERLVRVLVMGLAAIVVLTPWIVRNNLAMQETVTITSSTGVVLVQANCDSTYFGSHIGWWDIDCQDPWPFGANGERLDESQESTVYTARAREYMSENTGRLLAVVIPARVGRMWGILEPLEQVRIEIAEGRPAFSSWLGFWQYVILVPLALAGVVIQWRRREPVLVIALWAVLATITAATAFGGIRYRSGAEVAIVVFAAITLDALLGRRSVDRSRETSAGTDHESSGGMIGDPTVKISGN